MGTISRGGTGCACPASALLKALLMHLLIARDEVVILDMEAGVEHLGRGTATAVDAFIIVVEPSRQSIETGRRIAQLAKDINIKRIYPYFRQILPSNFFNFFTLIPELIIMDIRIKIKNFNIIAALTFHFLNQ